MKWNVIYCYSNCDYDGHFGQVVQAECKRLVWKWRLHEDEVI
jgi:hypothetical protein